MYISVIVPLALPWEPVYRTDEPGVAVGSRIRVRIVGRSYVGVVSGTDVTPEVETSRIHAAEGLENGLEPVSAEEIRYWRALADYYLCTVGEVYKAAYPVQRIRSEETAVRIRERMEKRLEKTKGLCAKARKETTRARYSELAARLEQALREGHPAACEAVDPPVLSPILQDAAAQIRTAFSENPAKTVLVEGGSGRTDLLEVLAAETLAEGRSVLWLVPEIALTKQLEGAMEERFPGMVRYHSGETAPRRSEVSALLRSGTPSLVLGTRSALLLPWQHLGLIILDDEHDPSYKQEAPAPRYHAREAAILLAGICGARTILVSATPTLESRYNAAAGRFARILLPQPESPAARVPVELIDTRDERRKRGMTGHFSFKLVEALHGTLQSGGSAILVCTRRSPYTGPAAIEAEARPLFPDARIERLDADASPAEAKAVLDRFAAGETDLLIGPQSVTKAFDSERLSLVAFIQADALLGFADFRSDERALQILGQLRLRTAGCRFLIQTAQSDHPVLQSFAGETVERLLEEILAERSLFGYPPVTRLIQLTLRDENEKRVAWMAGELESALRRILPASTNLSTPPSAQETVRVLRIALPRDKKIRETKHRLAEEVAAFEKARKYTGHIQLDVDPV